MRQEDLVFTDVAEYTGTNIPVKFDPVIGPDVTPLMEKNRDILSDNFRRHQEAEERNIERENEAKRLADNANIQRISEFSEKLTGMVKMGVDIYKKEKTAELEIWLSLIHI